MKAFEPYLLGTVELKNRFVMAPMCMYSASDNGIATDFHNTHYVTRAIGGIALVIVEATSVTPLGRISEKDLGLWNDEQRDSLKAIVNKVHQHDAKIGIQIAHAGRKYGGQLETPMAPSAIPFDDNSKVPHALEFFEIKELVKQFVASSKRAEEAGFDVIEIHAAHGYLLHEFLSPISNQRTDLYGGSLENRVRFLKEVLKEVKEAISPKIALTMRVSASDYVEGGINCDEMVKIVNEVKEYVDAVHVSSGGLVNVPLDVYPGYQVNFSQMIKEECSIPTIAVGKIENIELGEEILGNQRADLIALGRELLRNPYYVLNQARINNIDINYPKQYERSFL